MATTATIDIATYKPTATDSTSSAKSYADNSNDFENIFNNVNKSYSDNNETDKQKISDVNNDKTLKKDDTSIQNNGEKAKKTDENNDTDSSEKTDDKNSQITSEENSTDSTNNNTQKTNNNENNNDDNIIKISSNSESNNKNTTNIQPENNEQIKIQITELIPKIETEVKSDSTIKQNSQEPNSVATIENIAQILPINVDTKQNVKESQQVEQPRVTQAQSVQPQIGQYQITSAQNSEVQEGQNQTNSTQNMDTQKEQTSINQVQIGQVQETDVNLIVDLNNSQGNLDEIPQNTESNNIKIQTQTQQALSNLKINPQNVLSETQKPQKQMQDLPITQSQNSVATQDASSQIPLIEADTDVITSNNNIENITGNKEISQNNSNKITINQEYIDKTNAKVINVENSNSQNSNSNNFSTKQNAQEQIAKMAIENNSSNQKNVQNVTQNTDLLNAIDITNSTDTISQPNFAKTIENIQTQQPKELSSTDILAQINKQLNLKHLQDEGTTKINIILKPENLGKINLELINSKDGLTAKMTTDNAQVKELLDKNLNSLKDSLGNQGVSVSNVTIKVETTQKQSNDMFSFQHGQSNTGNQGSSNNTQNQNQKESHFDDKLDKVENEPDQENETESIASMNNSNRIENTVSFNSNSRKINYKI